MLESHASNEVHLRSCRIAISQRNSGSVRLPNHLDSADHDLQVLDAEALRHEKQRIAAVRRGHSQLDASSIADLIRELHTWSGQPSWRLGAAARVD